MKPQFTIDELIAADLPFEDEAVDQSGVSWKKVSYEPWDKRRWYTVYQLAVQNDEGEVWGHDFLEDNSESQDGQFEESERWDGDWYKMKPVQVTKWVKE